MKPTFRLPAAVSFAAVLAMLAACGDESTGPAPATQLVFSIPPVNDTIGAIPLIRVTAQTAQGATASGFAGTVILTLGTNPAGALLSGTTSVVATNGVASFPNLSMNKAEDGYTLTATAGALTVTSAPFDIAEVSRRVAMRYESQGFDLANGTVLFCPAPCSSQGDFHIAHNGATPVHSRVVHHSTRAIAHLTGRSYTSVHLADTAGVVFGTSLVDQPFDNMRTILLRSAGVIYKLGNPVEFGTNGSDSVGFNAARLN